MNNAVGLAIPKGLGDAEGVQDVALYQFEPADVHVLGEALRLGGIVQHRHILAVTDQDIRDLRTDQASSNQQNRHASPPY